MFTRSTIAVPFPSLLSLPHPSRPEYLLFRFRSGDKAESRHVNDGPRSNVRPSIPSANFSNAASSRGGGGLPKRVVCMQGGRGRKGCIRNSNRVFALFEIAGNERTDGRARDGDGGRGTTVVAGDGRLMKPPPIFYEIVHPQGIHVHMCRFAVGNNDLLGDLLGRGRG